ncbi:hypothetical protein AAP_05641 [Ascosphaera apis ARSEF 7405]|uniref:Nuclear pore assembly and biogenesis protein, APQ12 n=1 Tax=Ascosphaera apis ARSEF 7405 TaxID=392613 RepID=A0A167VEF7_9EURO|nr:hypothetical protein AAP_05641 [Ascosphaera apis ARSEF 7405]
MDSFFQEDIQAHLYTILKYINYLPAYIPFPLSKQYNTFISTIDDYTHLYIQPLLNQPPTLGNILALAICLWLSLRLLDYLRRVIVFWVLLFVKIVFWGAVGVFGWYVYTSGVEEGVMRMVELVAWVQGLVAGVVDGEVQRYANERQRGGRGF